MGHGLSHNKETGRKSFWENCQEIDSMLQKKRLDHAQPVHSHRPYALIFTAGACAADFP